MNPADNHGAVNIIFASDNNFVRYLGTAILSLTANKLPATKIDITVLDDGMSEENKEKLRQCVVGDGVALHFLDIGTLHLDKIQLPSHERWSKTIYARLFAPDIVPYKRYLYLDCDMVIRGDLQELFDIDLGGAPIGAVRDASEKEQERKLMQHYGLSVPKHLNSGLLLVDADAWKRARIGERAMEFIQKYVFLAPDQDALNCVCAGNWKVLDGKYNDRTNRDNPDAVIIHYVQKPFRYFSYLRPAAREIFFSYFRRTPWGGEKIVYPDKTLKNRVKKPLIKILAAIGIWRFFADMRETAILKKMKAAAAKKEARDHAAGGGRSA